MITPSYMFVKATVTARRSDGLDHAIFEVTGVAYREGGSAILYGTPVTTTIFATGGAASWTATIDVTGTSWRLMVTGDGGNSIAWVANITIDGKYTKY